MATLALRTDETAALVGAGLLHAALIAILLMQPEDRIPPPPPERVVVNLSEEVGMTSTAPSPVQESRASQAPTLSDSPAPPVPEPLPQVATPPPPTPQPSTAPRTEARPQTRPTTRPQPARTTAPRPAPTRAARPASTPTRTARPAPAPARAAAPRPSPTTAPARTGGSRIGSDFLPGAGTSTTTTETRVPASQIGASARSSLFSAIARELRPHWQPPSGVDAEKLVTKVVFNLNPDGTLSGSPQVRGTTGVTDANRSQVERHQEQAVRAVRLAAPFDLPEQYYEAWKRVGPLDFDWRLAQ